MSLVLGANSIADAPFDQPIEIKTGILVNGTYDAWLERRTANEWEDDERKHANMGARLGGGNVPDSRPEIPRHDRAGRAG